jgi:hypothetical protein
MKIITFVLVLLLSGCDPADGRLRITNNSSKKVYYTIAESSAPVECDLLRVRGKDTLWDGSQVIFPDSSVNEFRQGRNYWPEYVNKECKDSTLILYVFSESTVMKHARNGKVGSSFYNAKFMLNVKQLDAIKWNVVYDGFD